MHDHRTVLWRRLWTHRRDLALAAATAVAAAALLLAGPWLLLLAAVEWKTAKPRQHRRLLGLAVANQLWRLLAWLWRELAGAPHRPWHPCAQCGRPIEAPSRAAYCSHACRGYARLERDAQADDPRIAGRAERRLRAIRLQQLAEREPAWVEVPF